MAMSTSALPALEPSADCKMKMKGLSAAAAAGRSPMASAHVSEETHDPGRNADLRAAARAAAGELTWDREASVLVDLVRRLAAER